MTTPVGSERSAFRVRRARTLTLVWLATTSFTSLLMPGIGVLRETRVGWQLLGALGVLAFVVAQAGILYGSVTPGWPPSARRGWTVALLLAAVASLALVAPVAPQDWSTWSWVGAGIVGVLPLMLRRLLTGLLVAVLVLAAGEAVTLWLGRSPWETLAVIGGLGATVAVINWSPVWLWRLIADAESGREATATLRATEERLRFARDVHDLLGHRLSIIALKAELVERTADRDLATARQDATEIRGLAASALDDVRAAVAGYREVDLAVELDALRQVLQSSGVACDVRATEQVPTQLSGVLVPVLRESVTNVLRHSRARSCTISLSVSDEVLLEISNDGVIAGRANQNGSGLDGIAERLREAGGTLEVEQRGGQFVLRARVGVGS